MAKEMELEGKVTYGQPFSGEIYVLESQVIKAIDAMPWLTEADEGVIALALQYARRIDASLRVADNADPSDTMAQQGATKALYLGPHLVNALKALGGTPGDRMDLEAKRQAVTGPDPKEEEDPVASFLNDNLSKVQARARKR